MNDLVSFAFVPLSLRNWLWPNKLFAVLAVRYVEDSINRWLRRDGRRFGRIVRHAGSFLVVSTRNFGAGIGISAVRLGACHFRSAQLSCGG
jgi:hypothetical protein